MNTGTLQSMKGQVGDRAHVDLKLDRLLECGADDITKEHINYEK